MELWKWHDEDYSYLLEDDSKFKSCDLVFCIGKTGMSLKIGQGNAISEFTLLTIGEKDVIKDNLIIEDHKEFDLISCKQWNNTLGYKLADNHYTFMMTKLEYCSDTKENSSFQSFKPNIRSLFLNVVRWVYDENSTKELYLKTIDCSKSISIKILSIDSLINFGYTTQSGFEDPNSLKVCAKLLYSSKDSSDENLNKAHTITCNDVEIEELLAILNHSNDYLPRKLKYFNEAYKIAYVPYE